MRITQLAQTENIDELDVFAVAKTGQDLKATLETVRAMIFGDRLTDLQTQIDKKQNNVYGYAGNVTTVNPYLLAKITTEYRQDYKFWVSVTKYGASGSEYQALLQINVGPTSTVMKIVACDYIERVNLAEFYITALDSDFYTLSFIYKPQATTDGLRVDIVRETTYDTVATLPMAQIETYTSYGSAPDSFVSDGTNITPTFATYIVTTDGHTMENIEQFTYNNWNRINVINNSLNVMNANMNTMNNNVANMYNSINNTFNVVNNNANNAYNAINNSMNSMNNAINNAANSGGNGGMNLSIDPVWLGLNANAASNTAGSEAIAIGVDSLGYNQWTVVGTNAGASGSTIASATGAVVIGYNATANASSGTAVGYSAYTNTQGIAIGYLARAGQLQSVCIGMNAYCVDPTTSSQAAVVIGSNATANGNSVVCIGRNTIANGGRSVSIGDNAISPGGNTIAIGYNTNATYTGALAVGSNAVTGTMGECAIAIGNGANAVSDSGISIGNAALTSGTEAISIGRGTQTTTSNGIAIGTTALVSGQQATAIGYNATAAGSRSTAIGYNATTSTTNTIQLGDGNVASLRCQVNLTVTSDERDKVVKDFIKGNDALCLMNNIKGVMYNWNQRERYQTKRGEYDKDAHRLKQKADDKTLVGFRAQEISQALQMVYNDPNYGGMIVEDDTIWNDETKMQMTPELLLPFMVEAIKELAIQVQELRER